MNKAITWVIVGALLVAGGYLVLKPALSPAPGNVITQGIIPAVSSEANVVVGPQNALTVAAAATNCASRIVSTASTSASLSFKSSFTPTGAAGVYQAASTTKEYDNGVYGCGAISAWASASSTLHVVTTSQ